MDYQKKLKGIFIPCRLSVQKKRPDIKSVRMQKQEVLKILLCLSFSKIWLENKKNASNCDPKSKTHSLEIGEFLPRFYLRKT
jgi:hypothetical protein